MAGAEAERGEEGSWWERFPTTRWLWVCLVVVMGVGAFLRFWRLGYQAYWTDEGYTLGRIQGTFDHLLASLTKEQGFPPGWYTLLRWWAQVVEWWTGDGAYAFSPEATRVLPALCGTLTVPAVYFLARQFTDRRGALLVMVLAAVNPFLIYYSRDIKMYAGLWLFATLNMAIFFRWQTTHKHLRWFVWYALTGAAMTSMHAMAWVLVALQLVFVLTRPRVKAWDAPLWLLGVGVMSLLPLWWYVEKATFLERLTNTRDEGMGWIQIYTDMSWQTLAGLGTSHVLGYLWPVYPPGERLMKWFDLGKDFNAHLGTRSWAWMADAQMWVAVGVGAVMVLGLIPWRGIRRSAEREASVTRGRWWWVMLWLVVPPAFFALTWIPVDSPWFAWVWSWTGHDPKPLWEPRYLGILVPAWLLWLGASLRRLPLWPVRLVLIVAVVGACGFSALSNQLLLRNTPYNRVAAVVAKYFDKKAPGGGGGAGRVAVGVPGVTYPDEAEDAAMPWAMGVRPGSGEDRYSASGNWVELPPAPARPPGVYVAQSDESCKLAVLRWVLEKRADAGVRTIVLVDRYGDIADPADRLATASVQKMLDGAGGRKWKLVEEEALEWHYEWRFYIFHTWRIRVWQLQ